MFLTQDNIKLLFKILKKKYKISLGQYKKLLLSSMLQVHNEYSQLDTMKKNKIVLSIMKTHITLGSSVRKQDSARKQDSVRKQDTREEIKNDKYILNKNLIRENMNKIDTDTIITPADMDTIKDMFIITEKFEKVENYDNTELLLKVPDELQEILDINKKNSIITTNLTIDSRDRNHDKYLSSNEYTIDLNRDYKQILSIELKQINYNNSDYIINSSNNSLTFLEEENTPITIIIDEGDYTIEELLTEVETELNNAGTSTYTVNFTNYLNKSSPKDTTYSSSGISSYAYDNDIDNNWSGTTNAETITYAFNSLELISRYTIFCTEPTGLPKSWTFEGSTDNINWVALDIQTDNTVSQYKFETFNIDFKYSGKYFRLSITDTNDLTGVNINNITLQTKSDDYVELTSDLNGGNNIFDLQFSNTTNSISSILGFLPTDYASASNYQGENIYNLSKNSNLYMELNDFPFAILPLSDNFNYHSLNFIYIIDTIKEKFDKLDIKFKRKDESLFNFNGFENSFIVEIKELNFN